MGARNAAKLLTIVVAISGVAATAYVWMQKQPDVSTEIQDEPRPSIPQTQTNQIEAAPQPDAEEAMKQVLAPQTLPNEKSIIFVKPVSDDVLRRLTPAIEARFSAGRGPLGYVKHRVVEIDVEGLEREMRNSLRATEEGKDPIYVTVPLFDDQTFDVVIERWYDGNFGGRVARGRVSTAQSADLNVTFSFYSGGNTKGVFNMADNNYLIEKADEIPYYVIYELERINLAM